MIDFNKLISKTKLKTLSINCKQVRIENYLINMQRDENTHVDSGFSVISTTNHYCADKTKNLIEDYHYFIYRFRRVYKLQMVSKRYCGRFQALN